MRTFIKKQLMNLLDSMKQLQSTLFGITDRERIALMLADCQHAAIAIGETLERDSSDHEQIVSLLEEYCEEAFRLSELEEAVCKGKISILDDLANKIKSLLIAISSYHQVVFMPYKASMWDSLESIWLACKEDERCQCVVVPIPYYEFDSQMNRWVYHYDGDQFPKDIPIVYYNDYSLEQSCPEIAYIHNPYDNCNLVTRIDQQFYSGELKRYVDKLVYVPYYITSGYIPREHLRFPVYRHMDYMIVQSEYGKASCSGMYYYDKLLPLGSPKLDRVIRMCKEGIDIPDTWKPLLSGKKVMMLNTSIGCFLQDGQVYLEKIKRICEVLKGRNQVALIWRPHPLLTATIKSMRPYLLDEFINLKEYFIKNQIGVLDETPDITRAVGVSDAYIGEEGTSVIYLFEAAGKPVFILNNYIIDQFTAEEKRRIHITDITGNWESMWITTDRYNALFNMKNDVKSIHYVGRVKEQPKWYGAYPFLTEFEKKLFLSPCFANCPAQYCMDSCKLELTGDGSMEKSAFKGRVIPYGKRLFYLPFVDGHIAELDTQTGEWNYHTECIQKLWEEAGQDEAVRERVIWGCAVSRKEMWLTATYSNRILRFNMEDGTYSFCSVGDKGNGYSGIAVEERYLWLAEINSGDIIKWDRKSGRIKTFSMPESFQCWNNVFGRNLPHMDLIDMGKYIVTIPGFSNCMVKLEKKTGRSTLLAEKFWKKSEEIANGYHPQFFLACEFGRKIDQNVVMVQRHFDDAVALLHVEEETYEINYPTLGEEEFEKLTRGEDGFEKMEKTSGFFRKESRIFSFEAFVDDLIYDRLKTVKERQMKELSMLSENLDGTCGTKVHEFMMNVLESGE